MNIFDEYIIELRQKLELAKESQDVGAAMRILDLEHQIQIKEFEIENLIKTIKKNLGDE